MAFLVLLITLVCYKLLGLRVSKNHDRWFFVFANKAASLFSQPTILVTLLILLAPIAAAGLALTLFEDALFGLVGVVLHVLLLFYAFGRDNLLRCSEEYLSRWQSGDIQSAYHFASEHYQVDDTFEANNLASLQRDVRAGILYQWFEQVFLVLFWYLVAGPLAALFIRLLCLYDQWLKTSDAELSPLQLLHAIEWLPTRLLGFTFAVAGNFTLCFQSWIKAISNWQMPTKEVLNSAGLAALGVCAEDMIETQSEVNQEAVKDEYAEELKLIQDLVVRSLVVWLVVVAIIAIA